jgi:hypothetical protein
MRYTMNPAFHLRACGRAAAWIICWIIFLAIAPWAAAGNEALDLSTLVRVEVQPQKFELHGLRDQAITLVTGYFPNGVVVDLTREAQITSTNPAIVECRDASICPKGGGQCELTVRVGSQTVSRPVVVLGFDQPAPISFRTETVAALTRQGCNSGACHGSPSGKGGFQLSLQAYDSAMDELSLTRAEKGRRLNCIEPEQSLLLLKPTMTVPHRGGLQLNTTDYAYEVLRQWIAEGGGVDAPEGRRCIRLELLPASGRVLKYPHLEQQIVARAHFDNGLVRDVTRLTKFSSSEEQIASVSGNGVMRGHRRGQVAVMARYLDQLVSCQFTLVQDMDGFKWPNPPVNNYVDDLVYEKLRQLQFEPAAVCSDNEFVRRVYVDVIGALPTIAEQDAFFADQQPDRRQRLIDSLLERPEHARFWALKWGDLLRLRKSRHKETGEYKF